MDGMMEKEKRLKVGEGNDWGLYKEGREGGFLTIPMKTFCN